MRVLIPWILTGLVLTLLTPLSGQRLDRHARKLREMRSEAWPPQRSYARLSLGYALQRKFRRHAEYCGFAVTDGRRDYVPADISKFLGRRDLRTKVETADIRGGGLLYYLFLEDELGTAFDYLDFSPSRVFRLENTENQFVVNPDENFDTFILTKNCGSYLKASLDAGIEPPYAAFKAALDTDSRRESMVLALSGSFLSPLKVILDANDYRTTEALMKLWKFYLDNPQYVGRAYYLREFEGVMIKHITSAEESLLVETSGGLNLNGPLGAHLKTSFGLGASSLNTFSGSDWETVVFAEFEREEDRYDLFSPLPSPAHIRRYFESIQPVYQQSSDFPLMSEGVEHKHFLIVEGIPENMTNNFWEIAEVTPGVYEGQPVLEAEYFSDDHGAGCRFTVTGRPLPANFLGGPEKRLDLRYEIRSRYPVGGEYLRFIVNQEVQTSRHPVAKVVDGSYDLSKKDNRRFALQWITEIEIEDSENPIDFSSTPYIGNLEVRRSDKRLNVKIVEVEPDVARKRLRLVLETQEAFPLERIDDLNLLNYNLSLDIHLKSRRSEVRSVRPVKGIVSFPSIRPEAPEPQAEKTPPPAEEPEFRFFLAPFPGSKEKGG